MAIGTLTAIGLGVQGLAGIGSAIANMSANDRAAAANDKAVQEWLKINVPDPAQQKLVLQKFVTEGALDPSLESAIKQSPSEFSKVVTGVQNKNAQQRALSSLQQIGDEGGLRLQDKAALTEANLDASTRARGERDAITSEMARRGLGGSGFELQAKLAGQQGDADRAARTSLGIASGANQRALQAISDAGDLGTKFRGQDFQEQSAKAQAQDAINRFNTANLQDVNQRNNAALNAAQKYNLDQKQSTSDQNTKLANYQQEKNTALTQQEFENQMAKAKGSSSLYGQGGQIAQQGGQIVGNTISNIGGAAANTANVAANYSLMDKYFNRKKTDPDFDY